MFFRRSGRKRSPAARSARRLRQLTAALEGAVRWKVGNPWYIALATAVELEHLIDELREEVSPTTPDTGVT